MLNIEFLALFSWCIYTKYTNINTEFTWTLMCCLQCARLRIRYQTRACFQINYFQLELTYMWYHTLKSRCDICQRSQQNVLLSLCMYFTLQNIPNFAYRVSIISEHVKDLTIKMAASTMVISHWNQHCLQYTKCKERVLMQTNSMIDKTGPKLFLVREVSALEWKPWKTLWPLLLINRKLITSNLLYCVQGGLSLKNP